MMRLQEQKKKRQELNAKNDATATATKTIDGTAYYILNVNGGLTFYSKCGTNDIPIRLNADFGSF